MSGFPFNENRGYVKDIGDGLTGGFGRSNTVSDGFSPDALAFIQAEKVSITSQPVVGSELNA